MRASKHLCNPPLVMATQQHDLTHGFCELLRREVQPSAVAEPGSGATLLKTKRSSHLHSQHAEGVGMAVRAGRSV
jgi:hypothetical protein